MIKLWNTTPGYDESYGQPEPYIVPYIVESDKPTPSIIVCPGGAYSHLAAHEGEPICRWLNSFGISAFCLSYRLKPYNHKYITNDVLRAIRVVRYNAEEYNVDAEKIGVLGFSAGGHLASSATVHYNDAELSSEDPIDSVSSRPFCSVLCYPVISADIEISHTGSFKNLLGNDMTIELLNYYSNEKQVTEDTPSVFLWHTAEDPGVPCANSLAMAKSLWKHNVLCELHIYPEGRHGLGLAEGHGAADWTKACEKWLLNIFGKEA